MGMRKVVWSWTKDCGGEIQTTKCQRFKLVTGSQHYTLLDRGIPVHRCIREDHAKQYAQTIVDREAECRV